MLGDAALSLLATLRRWHVPLATSVVDQGIVAGSHFVLNILLARTLGPSAYGAFAISFMVLLFVSGIHAALVVEPMSALGATRPRDELPSYTGRLVILSGSLAACALIAAVAVLGILYLAGFAVGWSAAGGGLALGPLLLFTLLRQACYLQTRPRTALLGSVCYAVVLLGVSTTLLKSSSSRPTALSGYAALALAGGAASLVLAGRLSVQLPSLRDHWTAAELRRLAGEHWSYGRWLVAATVAHTAGYLLYLPMIGATLGLAQSGIFRATQTLTLPLMQILAAFAGLLVPWVSRQRSLQGSGYLRRVTFRVLGLNVVTAAVYGAALVLAGRRLLELLFGREYAAFAWLVPFFALAAQFTAVSDALGTLVRAVRLPRLFVWSKLAAAAVMLVVGFAAIRAWALEGAAASLVFGAFFEALVLAWQLRKRSWAES
jgi:O-antigen/teichoic acid export membrane protein